MIYMMEHHAERGNPQPSTKQISRAFNLHQYYAGTHQHQANHFVPGEGRRCNAQPTQAIDERRDAKLRNQDGGNGQ